MKIGVLTEIKTLEGRVGITPFGVEKILKSNPGSHEIFVQTQAGIKSGFSDDEYVNAGAKILPTAEAVYDQVTLIVPLLAPMSAVAGKMAFVYALYCSQKHTGGQGVYLGQIEGKTKSNCIIIGGGYVGVNSAESFLGI